MLHIAMSRKEAVDFYEAKYNLKGLNWGFRGPCDARLARPNACDDCKDQECKESPEYNEEYATEASIMRHILFGAPLKC